MSIFNIFKRGKLYTFIGEDGSLGYKNGKQYRLKITKNYWGDYPIVITKPTYCPYSSQEAFLQNWKPVKK